MHVPLHALRLPRPWLLPPWNFALEAAVAVVLRGETVAQAEVLLMRRAQRDGDPWSGDMSFPGGRRDPDDADLALTAVRETREEVGLDLGPALALGRLRQVVTLAPHRGAGTASPHRPALGVRPMVVSPFVFVLPGEAPSLVPSAEAVATRWVPLAALERPEVRTRRPWRVFGVTVPAPAWQIGSDVIWGLTYNMLRSLRRTLAMSVPR